MPRRQKRRSCLMTTSLHWMFEMHFTGVIAIVAVYLLCGAESQVSLNRTAPSGMQSVCPNTTAVFTCRVTGSFTIVWKSAEYIGGNQLGFTRSSIVGTTMVVSSDVVAELTLNSGSTLESQLSVRANIDSSISCNPDNADSGVTVNLTIYNGFAGGPTDVAAVESASSIDDSCTILVDWDPPIDTSREDISHYIVRESINGDREEITTSTTSTLVTLQLRQCPNNLLISISAVDRCGREGPSAGVMPSFLPTDATVNSTTNTPSNAASSSSAAIALSVFVVLLFAVILAIIVVIPVIFIVRSRRKIRQSTDEQRLLLNPEVFELGEHNEHELPRYDEHDVGRIRDDKRPQSPTQKQEQNVKTFMSEVVILLLAVMDEEMVAVYDRLEPPLDLEYTLLYQTNTGIEVTLGIFGDHKAALIHISKGGDCQSEIKRALKSLPQVQLIIAVGFAYGKRDKCKLGDVLVSTAVDGVSNLKIDKSGKIKIEEGSVIHLEISAKTKKAFTKRKWIDFVCTSNGERESEIYCGVVVSSPMLLNNRDALQRLIARQKRYIGGEMEGQELAQLIHHKEWEYRNIDFIVIKGVADFGDGTKEKDWRFTASMAAATFAETRLKETQNYLQEQTQDQIGCLQHAVGVENAEWYEAYKAALKGGKTVTLQYVRFLLIGVPRSGKSTMRRRLLREIINLYSLGQPSISTGVAETSDILVKELTTKSATISDSKWEYLKKGSSDASQADGNDGGLDEENNTTTEATVNVADTGTQQATTDTTVESVADESGDPDQKDVGTSFGELTNIHSPGDLHRQQGTSTDTTTESVADESGDFDQREIDAAFKKLTNILQSDSPEDFHRLLEALTLINLMDIGRQPEFLDMLPAVTIGAALYLLFFRLDRDLHKHYPVTFLAPGENSEKTLETSYCMEEVIHQALASITCFSGQSSEDKAESASSRAILIGTHKDKVKAKDIVHKEEEVNDKFLNVGVYKDLLLPTEEGKSFFAVDNMNGTDESEMSEIRSSIENIVKTFFPEVPIPASWLMFRIVLQILDKPVVTLAQCEEIARRLSMPTPVQEALCFFHHKIGSLLYYQDIPSVKDLVMCTPQVIFDSITTVIIDKFKHGKYYLSNAVKKQFQQTGLFSLSDISKKTERHRSTHLTPNQLVDVLKHNGILAEVECDDEEATSSEPVEPKFIIPAVLKHASEEELKPSTSLEASPLMIRFEGGFVPFGVFSASIAHLIAHTNSLSPAWSLHGKEVKKNKVKFLVAKAFLATLISRPRYLEIHVEKYPGVTCEHTLAQVCSTIRQTVVETLETTISRMKYQPLDSIVAATFLSSHRPFHLAFTCCLDRREHHSDHLMKISKDENGHYGECLLTGVKAKLNKKHLLWFEQEDLKQRRWRDGETAPVTMEGVNAVVNGNVAYFMSYYGQIYSYSKRWSELPKCPCQFSSLAVIRGLLTAIGGLSVGVPQNKLLSIVDKKWVEHFPPMPTKRYCAVAVTTHHHLIVAGGEDVLNTVEVMDIESLVWSTVASLPHPYAFASAAICGGHLYMLGGVDKDGRRTKSVLTCSLTNLLQSSSQTSSHSVWNSISDAPVYRSTCVAVDGELLAVGGEDEENKTTSAVYKYNPTTDSWDLISNMPTARRDCFVAVLPTNEMMVVGGSTGGEDSDSVEIVNMHFH